jgi:hypothetical protein
VECGTDRVGGNIVPVDLRLVIAEIRGTPL